MRREKKQNKQKTKQTKKNYAISMCNVFKWLLNGYFISIKKTEKKYYYIHDNNYECFRIYISGTKSALPMPMRRVY